MYQTQRELNYCLCCSPLPVFNFLLPYLPSLSLLPLRLSSFSFPSPFPVHLLLLHFSLPFLLFISPPAFYFSVLFLRSSLFICLLFLLSWSSFLSIFHFLLSLFPLRFSSSFALLLLYFYFFTFFSHFIPLLLCLCSRVICISAFSTFFSFALTSLSLLLLSSSDFYFFFQRFLFPSLFCLSSSSRSTFSLAFLPFRSLFFYFFLLFLRYPIVVEKHFSVLRRKIIHCYDIDL